MQFLRYSLPAADMYPPVQHTHMKQFRNTEYAADLLWLCVVSYDVILFIQAAMIRYLKEYAWRNEHY